jgi:hypothetical protein
MKILKKVIAHPLLLILSFCAIIISGEHLGGFYIMYIAMGLSVAAFHSIFGTIGILCLLISHYSKTRSFVLNLAGITCMIVSLFRFFLQPNGSYNYNTFNQFLPLASLIIFGILSVIFIIFNCIKLFKVSA